VATNVLDREVGAVMLFARWVPWGQPPDVSDVIVENELIGVRP
jgi:hypothetical protein